MVRGLKASGITTGVSLIAIVASLGLVSAKPVDAAEELNALVWCDHTDPALIEPFEEANDVKVNLKDYEGTGTALSLIEQSQARRVGCVRGGWC